MFIMDNFDAECHWYLGRRVQRPAATAAAGKKESAVGFSLRRQIGGDAVDWWWVVCRQLH